MPDPTRPTPEEHTDAELLGGQVWEQTRFPFMSCYLVYLGKDGWCRINKPDQRGNIVQTDEDEPGMWKWQYTTEAMEALLAKYDYELVGQFSDILDEQMDRLYVLGQPDA